MSETEVRDREGLPYGGMPHDVLLYKLEETDTDLVRGIRGGDPFRDDMFRDYARSEIIDRTPDPPYLESDHTRRDPGLSKSILNLRFNGTRGSRPELPRHPELFIGFTGDDPRGAVNDPRFEQVRGHITSRAGDLTVRMGDNDDHHIAERPWTGQSISYAKKEMQRRWDNNLRVFSTQNEGRPWARNIDIGGAVRASGDRSRAVAEAGESIPAVAGTLGAAELPAEGLASGGVRGVDGGKTPGTETAPWRHTGGDASPGTQQLGQTRGAGRGLLAPAGVGGGRLAVSGGGQAWAAVHGMGSVNRQVLGASMGLAARARRVISAGTADQGYGKSQSSKGMPAGGLAPARDSARAHYAGKDDQDRRPTTGVQDGDGGVLGAAAGLTPAEQPGRAVRFTEVAVASPNARLANVAAVVSCLRQGSTGELRRVAGSGVAETGPAGANGGVQTQIAGGLRPSADYGRAPRLAVVGPKRPGATGLEAQTYAGQVPSRPDPKAEIARGAHDPSVWNAHREAPPLGRSQLPQRRSATHDPSTLGDEPGKIFGANSAAEHAPPRAAFGTKSLRAGTWSDTSMRAGEFDTHSSG